MNTQSALLRVKNIVSEVPAYGKLVAVVIFLTHGVADYITTLTAYLIAGNRGMSFSDVEKNPLLSGADPIEMFVVIIGSAGLISIVCLLSYYVIEREGGRYNRLFAHVLFTILAGFGVYIVVNNILFLVEFV